jgi:hypothetical protein
MIIGVVLIASFLVVGLLVMLGLRSWTLDEVRTEDRLHRPGAHTVGYVLPVGQDPTPLVAALSRAGFTARADMEGGRERLVVECEQQQRSQVREIIAGAEARLAGAGAPAVAVSFEDER